MNGNKESHLKYVGDVWSLTVENQFIKNFNCSKCAIEFSKKFYPQMKAIIKPTAIFKFLGDAK